MPQMKVLSLSQTSTSLVGEAGKYSQEIGAMNENTCIECPPGKSFASTGHARETDCQNCPVGKYGEGTGFTSRCVKITNPIVMIFPLMRKWWMWKS